MNIKERIYNKCLAKLDSISRDLRKTQNDLDVGNLGPLNREQLIELRDFHRRELAVWSEIMRLNETSE